MALALSPTATNLILASADLVDTSAFIALQIAEWTPPHRPLSEEIATIRWFGLLSSDSTSNLS